jgi:hypothetical protein
VIDHLGPDCDEEPVIDWPVMQDPFGDEFCLVYELTDEQSTAAIPAASGPGGTLAG